MGKKQNFQVQSLNPKLYFVNSEKGLTLIEVLLAVSILAIGIVGVLQAYAGSLFVLETSQYSVEAVGLLKQKMIDVEQVFFEQETIAPGSEHGEFEEPFEDFLWEWNVQSAEIEDLEDLNKLTVVVSHKYNPRDFSLKTYVVNKKKEEEE